MLGLYFFQHIKTVLPVEQLDSNSSESESDSETGVSSVSVDESSTCSSSYASSSTRFSVKSRRWFNGSVSSKDNTPEPPSFRGKIRKPRDYDTKLTCHSPFSKANLEDGGRSSKDVTPEPTVSCRKRKRGRAQGSDASCDSPVPKSNQETINDQSQPTNSNCDRDKLSLTSENVELVKRTEIERGDDSSLTKPTVNNSSCNENYDLASEPVYNDRLDSCDKLIDPKTASKSSASKVSNGDNMCNSEDNASQDDEVKFRIKPGVESTNHNNDLVGKEMDSGAKCPTNGLLKVGMTTNAKTESESVSVKCEEASICDVEGLDCVKPVRNHNDNIMNTKCEADVHDSKTVTEFKNESNNVEENIKTEDCKMDAKPCDSMINFPESLGKQTSIKREVKQEEDKETCSLSLLANMAVANMSCYSKRESGDAKGSVADCNSEKNVESEINTETSREHGESEKEVLKSDKVADSLNFEHQENCEANKYPNKTKLDSEVHGEGETNLTEEPSSKDLATKEAAAEEEMVEEEDDVEEVVSSLLCHS